MILRTIALFSGLCTGPRTGAPALEKIGTTRFASVVVAKMAITVYGLLMVAIKPANYVLPHVRITTFQSHKLDTQLT